VAPKSFFTEAVFRPIPQLQVNQPNAFPEERPLPGDSYFQQKQISLSAVIEMPAASSQQLWRTGQALRGRLAQLDRRVVF
jgi:hypothetical protein